MGALAKAVPSSTPSPPFIAEIPAQRRVERYSQDGEAVAGRIPPGTATGMATVWLEFRGYV